MNWEERLERAEKEGFTSQDVCDAAKWESCAVAEKQFLSGQPIFTPEDEQAELHPELYRLGVAFGQAVRNEETTLAKEIYRLIQEEEIDS